jgi:hypothetical protein
VALPTLTLHRAATLAALVAVVLCLPILGNGFAIDDAYLIVENQGIRSLGHIPDFFRHPWGGGEGAAGHVGINDSYYRPITTSLYALEYAMLGLRPAGWHFVSILLHAANTALLTLLAARLTRRLATALVAGLLFATHPVHSEAIAAASYQSTLLACLFSLATLLAFAPGLEENQPGKPPRVLRLPRILVFSMLAFLSKEESIALPMLAFAWVFFHRAIMPATSRRTVWTALVGTGAIAAVSLILRTAIVTRPSLTYFGDAGPGIILPTMARVITLYTELFLIPIQLCPFYDWFILPPSPAIDGQALVGILLVVASILAILALRKRFPALATALSWLILALSPVMHFVPILNVAAERFLYLPSLGFCIALGIGFSHLFQRAPKAAIALATILICLYATRTFQRWPDWRSDHTLNQATARDFSTPTPHINLAQIEAAQGNQAQALHHLDEAERRAPGWPVPAKLRARILGTAK